jgi:hypothetical protein
VRAPRSRDCFHRFQWFTMAKSSGLQMAASVIRCPSAPRAVPALAPRTSSSRIAGGSASRRPPTRRPCGFGRVWFTRALCGHRAGDCWRQYVTAKPPSLTTSWLASIGGLQMAHVRRDSREPSRAHLLDGRSPPLGGPSRVRLKPDTTYCRERRLVRIVQFGLA